MMKRMIVCLFVAMLFYSCNGPTDSINNPTNSQGITTENRSVNIKVSADMKMKMKMKSAIRLASEGIAVSIDELSSSTNWKLVAVTPKGKRYESALSSADSFAIDLPLNSTYFLFIEATFGNLTNIQIIAYADGRTSMPMKKGANGDNTAVDLGTINMVNGKIESDKTPNAAIALNPDMTQIDSDGDGIADYCALLDMNTNGVPDILEIAEQSKLNDSDGNGIDDAFEFDTFISATNSKSGNDYLFFVSLIAADPMMEAFTNVSCFAEFEVAFTIDPAFTEFQEMIYPESWSNLIIEVTMDPQFESLIPDSLMDDWSNSVVIVSISPAFEDIVPDDLMNQFTNMQTQIEDDPTWHSQMTYFIGNNPPSSIVTNWITNFQEVWFVQTNVIPANIIVNTNANLLVNGDASAGLTGWNVTEAGGSGWDTSSGVFYSSYGWDRKNQTVDLIAKGYSATQLDTEKPMISVGERYVMQYTDALLAKYRFNVTLQDASHSPLASYDTTDIFITNINWVWMNHGFTGYPTGVRYVYFEHGGRDWALGGSGWGGFFGTRMDDCYVKLGSTVSIATNTNAYVNVSYTQTNLVPFIFTNY